MNKLGLRAVVDKLELISGKSIDELVRDSVSGEDSGLCALIAVKCVVHPLTFFAESLKSYFAIDVQVGYPLFRLSAGSDSASVLGTAEHA